jgi:predicted TIM-barrel fold metal-dependent hydrolase
MTDRRRIIDAHHHLWNLDACHYPWLMEKGVVRFFGDPAPIQKNYLVADLVEDAASFELAGSVHVQVGVADGDEVRETEWLEATAERDGLPSAIVAYCDLAGADAQRVLDSHSRASRLRGVRQIVGRSESEDRATGSGALLENPLWRDNLGSLRERGLSFDLQLIPSQLPKVAEVLESLPGLKVALCHCGSPWDQSAAGLRAWRAGLGRLARLPDVYCKISGLSMFNHDWALDDIRPIVESCIDTFGPTRCMFGSNFPVDKLHNSWDEVWFAYEEIAGQYTRREQAYLFGETAATFYRLTD